MISSMPDFVVCDGGERWLRPSGGARKDRAGSAGLNAAGYNFMCGRL